MDNIGLDDMRKQIEKEIEIGLAEMYDLKRMESSKISGNTDAKDSLVLPNQSRYKWLEKLKENWQVSHRRIKDFNQKKIQKFQQIFRLKYMYIFNKSEYTYHNTVNAISKYTFNLNNDVELDIGTHIQSKEPIGLGSMFTGLRFYAFDKKLFFNTYGSFGDKNDFFFETNYLIKHNFLLDYVYRRNHTLNESVHHIFLNYIFSKDFQGNIGLLYKEKYDSMYLSLSCKKYFGRNNSLNTKVNVNNIFIKIGLDQINIKSKYKQRITDNFFTISNVKFEINNVYPMFKFKNSIIYSNCNRGLRLGYFYSVDGVGLEIGYNHGGIDLRLPFLLTNGLDFSDKPFSEGLIDVLKGVLLFTVLNFFTSQILKGFRHLFVGRNYSKEELFKRRSRVEESRNYAEKIIENINSQADANHVLELSKKNKGLIIHLVLYGNKKKLKYIMNNFLYMKIDDLKLFIKDIENEVFDVTIPTRYLIKNDSNNNFSSILFYQIPKTKILGFVNPIYSKNKIPHMLISYEVNGISNTILKKDSNIFQIPEVI